MKHYLNIMKEIYTFIFDVDGVLTDSTVYLYRHEYIGKKMSIKDGFAMKLAKNKGYNICIMTRNSDIMIFKRLRELNINHIYQGINNKKPYFDEYCNMLNISKKTILYMGDDLPDLEIMKSVALPCSPFDAVSEIKAISKYISPKKGGKGCVRDVIEQTLKIQNNWN